MSKNKIEDGGQAFPAEGGSDSGLHAAPGMTLRDYFAGQAILGFISDPSVEYNNPEAHKHWCAEAYKYADAMIAARTKQEPPQ